MAQKSFDIPELGTITVRKIASSRSMRLRIRANGEVVVTIPSWTPYKSGVTFAKSHAHWIQQKRPPQRILEHGQEIGKSHQLALLPTQGLQKPRSLVSKGAVTVRFPAALAPEDERVQNEARTACIRALRAQAEEFLPARLQSLAEEHDFTYADMRVKQLVGRWGSCDQDKRIIFNLFLMQLPWDCIDYVILHELTHTEVLRHGPPFWSAMEAVLPHTQLLRQKMKQYQPVLQ